LNRLAWQMTAGTVHPQKPALQKSNQSLACVDSWSWRTKPLPLGVESLGLKLPRPQLPTQYEKHLIPVLALFLNTAIDRVVKTGILLDFLRKLSAVCVVVICIVLRHIPTMSGTPRT
jgi:hypothetical protein